MNNNDNNNLNNTNFNNQNNFNNPNNQLNNIPNNQVNNINNGLNNQFNEQNNYNQYNNMNNNLNSFEPTTQPNSQNNFNNVNNQINNINNSLNNQTYNNNQFNEQNNLNSNANLNSNNNTKNENNKSKLLIIIVVVIAVILLLIIFSGGKSNSTSGNAYTAKAGDTLVVKEKIFDFKLKAVSELEKYTISNTHMSDGEFLRLKIHIDNLRNESLAVEAMRYKLLDENKNEVYETDFFNLDKNNFFNSTIDANQSAEDYIYFYTDVNNDTAKHFTDYSKINDVKYLEVAVITSSNKTDDGVLNMHLDEYYLELK